MAKKTYHHGNLREALIEAGLKLLETKGLESMTLRAVAREAKVSAMAPYRHFKDARDLAAAIAEQGFQKLREEMLDSIEGMEAGAEVINVLGQAYVSFATNNPEHMKLMFSGFFLEPGEYPCLESTGENAFAVLVEAITAAQAKGYVTEEDPMLIAISAWAFIHGVSILLMQKQINPSEIGFSSSEEFVSLCQGIFQKGWENTSKNSV